jgi:methylthioribose-1-phosphate isomerase
VLKMRSVFWDYSSNQLKMIDQRHLPARFEMVAFQDYRQVAEAIHEMVVRGAPAIGAAAAFGMALAALASRASERSTFLQDLHQAAEVLKAARPTAVNPGLGGQPYPARGAGFAGARPRTASLDPGRSPADCG